VEDGITGMLTRVGDAAALGAALDRLAALDPAERAALGAAGRRRCEERYGWAQVVDRLEQVYAEVA
jgi:glycosyltransferase involved in cell wall biosynthesis